MVKLHTPLLEEIELIVNSEFQHYIIIDDFRFIAFQKSSSSSWPRIDEVCFAIQGGKYKFSIYIAGDSIIAVPKCSEFVVVDGIDNDLTYY